MDADRFDALTKALRFRLSRRAAIGSSAGVAALLGLAHPEVALARCSATKPCGACKICKKGECRPEKKGTLCAGGGGICKDGRCRCAQGKYCANSNECRGCCTDKECAACEECTFGFDSDGVGRYRCRKKDEPSCGISAECTAYVCNKNLNEWVCKNTCCDTFAGEEACGPSCCNTLLKETCCNGLCCNDQETCVAEKCVPKNCPDGRKRCGGVCCAADRACVNDRCKECSDVAPVAPDCWQCTCKNPGAPTGSQFVCESKCKGQEGCYNGACAICPPDKTECFDNRVGLYDCCTSSQYCAGGNCACCFNGNICCDSGDCCLPGKCVPGGGCFL